MSNDGTTQDLQTLANNPVGSPAGALCADCFTAAHGYSPEMGDECTSFAPGACRVCGRGAIVFRLDLAALGIGPACTGAGS